MVLDGGLQRYAALEWCLVRLVPRHDANVRLSPQERKALGLIMASWRADSDTLLKRRFGPGFNPEHCSAAKRLSTR